MNDEPDPLVDTALSATERGDVDWALIQERLPAERATIQALAEIAEIFTAHAGVTAEEEDGSDSASADPAGREPSFRWGPLEVRRRLGAGSYGDVFVAWDPRLHREVALKLRRAPAGARSQRWLEEARRLARARHPHVVTVYGADVHDGRAGIWMEPVRGRTLEQRLRDEGPLSAREAAMVGIELCGALAAVHSAGLVHGDVKTHNVVREGAPGRTRDAGRIVLMDFGSAHESSDDDPRTAGTPLFTAPEVLAGGRSTPTADLWSLGVVLYRLVTGAWPIEANTLDELRNKMTSVGPTPLRSVRPELPAGFVAAVERALERDPARRWSDAAAFEHELLATLGAERAGAAETARAHQRRRRERRIAWAAAALLVLVAVVVLGYTRGRGLLQAWRMRSPALVGELVATRPGPTADAYMGSWVLHAGDVNGDGHEDVMVSAPGANDAGEVYLLTPDSTGLEPVLTFRGEKPGDWFGSLAAPGDINGDGYPDLAIAAITSDVRARDAGRVYVYFGGPHMDTVPDRIIDGTQAGQLFGFGISGGDVNGDGFADLMVGAPADSTSGTVAGRAWIYFGGPDFDTIPDLTLAGTENSNFGVNLAFLGDINGDGGGDFAVTAWSDPGGGHDHGAAFIYFGGTKLDDRPDLVLNGRRDGELFGIVRVNTGDVNGDGYPDIAIGAERADGSEPNAGSATVYFGGPEIDDVPDLRLGGEHRGDGFGSWIDGSTDIDGDGQVDLLVTAPWFDASHAITTAGRAYVYLGGSRLDATPDYVVTGPIRGGTLGTSGCTVRDRGGRRELLLGLKNATLAHVQCGGVQLIQVARWIVRPPLAQDHWAPGAQATLRWSGVTRADIAVSADGGHLWRPVARGAGGHRQNALTVQVPQDARDRLRVRLSDPHDAHDEIESVMALGPAHDVR